MTTYANVGHVLLKRGNTTQSTGYTGPLGELTYDTDLGTVRVHNNSTPGGVNTLATQAQVDAINSSISTITGIDATFVSNINALLANAATQQASIDSKITNANLSALSSGATYFTQTGDTVSLGQFAAQSITAGPEGIQIAGTGGVTIMGVAGAAVDLGGETSGSIVFNSPTVGIDYNDLSNKPTISGTDTGNISFTGDTIYDLRGVTIENADLSHGATAAVILPVNGSTDNIQINNTYGGTVIQSGTGSDITATWNFSADGTITVPLQAGYASQQIKYGLGNLAVWNDGQWTIGEFNGTDWGTQGIRIDPAIEGPTGLILPAITVANVEPVVLYNSIGNVLVGATNVEINTNNTNSWKFGGDGSITFPDNTVQTTAYTGVSNDLVWTARSFSNTNASNTQAVAYDSQGNAYSLIAQGPWNGPGEQRSTIVKLSAGGHDLWTIDLADGNSVNPWSLVCDEADNLYVIVQRLNGSVYNNIVMKLNGTNGSIMWEVTIQDSQNANNMQAVPFSGYVGMGPSSGVIVAGTAYNGNDHDFFITALGADGSFVSTLTYGDQWDQQAYSVAINPMSLDIVLVGRKESNTDNAYYLEIIKFVANGPVAWQKSITVDGNYDVQGTDVCLLADGNWAVVATHDIDNNNHGVITMKINNTDGTVMWSREIANGCTNISSSIATDGVGNIYISASTFGGTGTNNAPLVTKIIGAYDTNGSIIWQKYFRSPGDNWVVDNNWWNNIGSTGKTLAVHGNSLLVAASLAPLSPNSGPITSYGVVAQLSLLGEDETIGIFETRNSYLTDSAVTLTLADTAYDYTTSTQTLVATETISSTVGTLTFVIDHAGVQTSQLTNNGKSVSLQPNGILVNEIGRSVTGEFDGVTDSGNNFSNQPIGIKNTSGYKRLVGLTNSAQTWFDINTVATQLGVNPAWIMGLTIDYQVTSTSFNNNGSMTGQIIIASSNYSGYNISVTHSEAVLTQSNSTNDIVFANLDFWQPSGWTLQAIRTDSNSQQLDIIWTAKVFINASESYC